MPWLLVDVAIVVVVLLVLAGVLLLTWRSVKALGREVTRSTETLGALTPDAPVRPQR